MASSDLAAAVRRNPRSSLDRVVSGLKVFKFLEPLELLASAGFAPPDRAFVSSRTRSSRVMGRPGATPACSRDAAAACGAGWRAARSAATRACMSSRLTRFSGQLEGVLRPTDDWLARGIDTGDSMRSGASGAGSLPCA